ncbi:MAG: hypothetical protein ACI9RU_000344 [Litorivivens sp.]|jgi:hypothetical protein
MTSTQLNVGTHKSAYPLQSFPTEDVLMKQTQRLSRLAAIFNALVRESTEAAPVRIEYEYNSAIEVLETRILASSDNGILLENKNYLPLSSIYKIQFL